MTEHAWRLWFKGIPVAVIAEVTSTPIHVIYASVHRKLFS